MEKPAVVIIKDDRGKVVYMQYIDMRDIESYKEILWRMIDDSIQIETPEGETYYTMPEYVQNLLRKGKK